MKSEIKPICGLTRTKLTDVIPLDTPYSAFVFPTTFCNFKCVYCAHSLGDEGMKEKYNFVKENMSLDTFNNTIEQFKEFPKKLKMLSLTGQGEPLFNKNIAKMVEIAKKANIAERIEIISNAGLLTPSLADDLINAGLDTLRISLQGLSSKKYKEICGADIDFDKFLENIKYFYNHKKDTNLFVKIMDVALEKGEEEKFYETFGNCTDRMYIEKMRPVYDGVDKTEGMNYDADRYGRKINARKVCPLPFFMLGIFPNGDVEPCDGIYKPVVLGNVNNEKLIDMWNGQKLKDFWKMQLTNRFENPKCAVCCAPNDVSHPEDVLDNDIDELLKRLEK